MKDYLKSGITLLSLKNPIMIFFVAVIAFFLGMLVLIFFTVSFISGGFEVKGKWADSYDPNNPYVCIYNFDSTEYYNKIRDNYNISKADARNLINISVEEKADPTIVYAVLSAENARLTKSNIEKWARKINNDYIEKLTFDAYSIISDLAPETENKNGQTKTDTKWINKAMGIVNTLQPTLYCNTKSRIGESDGGGRIIIGDGLFSPPLNRDLVVTSNFGYRTHPITGIAELHRGVDFGCAAGEPILSVLSGTVYHATFHNSWGNYVLVDHHNGIYTLYAHMNALYVSAGDSVEAGTILGACGSTGSSTAPHLHLETMLNRPYGTLVNPLEYFNFTYKFK